MPDDFTPTDKLRKEEVDAIVEEMLLYHEECRQEEEHQKLNQTELDAAIRMIDEEMVGRDLVKDTILDVGKMKSKK